MEHDESEIYTHTFSSTTIRIARKIQIKLAHHVFSSLSLSQVHTYVVAYPIAFCCGGTGGVRRELMGDAKEVVSYSYRVPVDLL